MKVAEDSVAHVKSVYDKVKAQVDSAPRDDGTLLEKRKELQREVDVTKRTLAQQVPKNIKHKFLGLNLVFLNVSLLGSPISTFLPWLIWLSKILNCSNFSPKKFTYNLSLTIILLSYNWWYSCRAIWNGKPEGLKFDPSWTTQSYFCKYAYVTDKKSSSHIHCIVVVLECSYCAWTCSSGTDDTRGGEVTDGAKWTESWCHRLDKTSTD